MVNDDVRGQHARDGRVQPFLVAGVDGEQRLTLLDPIPNFVMDDEPDRVVHGIALLGASRAERDGGLPHGSRLDL